MKDKPKRKTAARSDGTRSSSDIGHFEAAGKKSKHGPNLADTERDEWNQYRAERPEYRPDVSGKDLRGRNFSGFDLSHLVAVGTRFTDCEFVEANLESMTANDADMSECNLTRCNLSRSQLTGVDLRFSNLNGAQLFNSILERARLQKVSLIGADCHKCDMSRADLRKSNLTSADFQGVNLFDADVHRSTLDKANFSRAQLERAQLRACSIRGANFSDAYMKGVDARQAKFTGSNLLRADLRYAILAKADLSECHLEEVRIFGAAIWNTSTDRAEQFNINISNLKEPSIYVDRIEAAQFVHLIIKNENLRHLVNVASSKLVLLLGRFSGGGRETLNALRVGLAERGYISVIFDFEKPDSRSLTEMVAAIAHLSSFIIAEVSDPHSIPHELMRIVPHLPSVPVKPIRSAKKGSYALFEDLYQWSSVLPLTVYESSDKLVEELDEGILAPVKDWLQQHVSRRGR